MSAADAWRVSNGHWTFASCRPRSGGEMVGGEMVDAGLLAHNDDGTFVAPSRALLDLAMRMLDAGVSIDIGTEAANLLRRRLSRAADDVVRLFQEQTVKSFAGKAGRPSSRRRSTRCGPSPRMQPD